MLGDRDLRIEQLETMTGEYQKQIENLNLQLDEALHSKCALCPAKDDLLADQNRRLQVDQTSEIEYKRENSQLKEDLENEQERFEREKLRLTN